ncbi:hypothetical protein [Xanthomonas phaseoli]|uniref:hypothetical protein n=1 Tax=Xanthomonas phaseoli TaxID=1985254 RepID=UPI001EEAD6FE|nr:hypothetical protein [Xanthomonas phaseoli]
MGQFEVVVDNAERPRNLATYMRTAHDIGINSLRTSSTWIPAISITIMRVFPPGAAGYSEQRA